MERPELWCYTRYHKVCKLRWVTWFGWMVTWVLICRMRLSEIQCSSMSLLAVQVWVALKRLWRQHKALSMGKRSQGQGTSTVGWGGAKTSFSGWIEKYWDNDNLISLSGMFKWTVQNLSNNCIISHLSLASWRQANLNWFPEIRKKHKHSCLLGPDFHFHHYLFAPVHSLLYSW